MVRDSRVLSIDNTSRKSHSIPAQSTSSENTFQHPARRIAGVGGAGRDGPFDQLNRSGGYHGGEPVGNYTTLEESDYRLSSSGPANALRPSQSLMAHQSLFQPDTLNNAVTPSTRSLFQPDTLNNAVTPSTSSSLGFSLPDLSPRDSNIITPKGPNSSKKPGKVGRVKSSGKQTGKKVKQLPANRWENFTRTSTSEDSNFWVAGTSMLLESEHLGTKGRTSVLDADYEDDYSELGLSMDRGAYNRQTKPKKQPNSLSYKNRMKTSSSVGNFRSVDRSPIYEDPRLSEEITDYIQDYSAMSKSASFHGITNLSTSDKVFTKTIQTTNETQEQIQLNQEHIKKPDTFVRRDQETEPTVCKSQENQQLKSAEDFISHRKPNIPKLMFQHPVERESVDFETTKRTEPESGKETGKSVLYNEFTPTNLEAILGKDRLDRLLKNLEESAWVEDETSTDIQGNVMSGKQDITLDSYRSETEVNAANPAVLTEKHPNLDDLGLHTHRPDLKSQIKTTSSYGQGDNVPRGNTKSESPQSSARQSTKYSFSSDEIYAQAQQICTSNKGTEGRQPHLLNDGDTSRPAATPDSGIKSVFATLSDKSHEFSKFDYIKGIQSVKKEFYKTVTVTDSTAVSDASMSTAKLSRQSAEEGFDTQGLLRYGGGLRRQRQESGGESRHSNSQEDHIEGIRQHVADIR